MIRITFIELKKYKNKFLKNPKKDFYLFLIYITLLMEKFF
jgi:hypothetical protein